MNELVEIVLIGGSNDGIVVTPTIIPITLSVSKVAVATLSAASAVTYISTCSKGCKSN